MTATNIVQPSAVSDRPTRRQWWSLLVLGLGLAIVIIDGTIVNVAIPSIRKELGASLKDVEWVSSIYALIYAALIVTFGRIGDQIGRRAIFVAGVATFMLGSILAGAAGDTGMLIAARALQGLGAAMTSPSTLSIISATFTGKFRGVAFGVWGAIAGAAAALGPLLGGFLTTNASWRWAFFINIPIGLVAILGAIFVVQESVEQRKGRLKFDVPGIILVGLGIGAIVFGLIEGQTYGWWTPKQTFTLGSFIWPFSGISITPVSFLVGILALTAFVLWELRLSRRRGDRGAG
jgi:MFS family permease